MSSVIQIVKSIYPIVLYKNDLISIFMNVYLNLNKMREIYLKTINLVDGKVIGN